MKDKTFADYCMRHGVKFPKDTVVIKSDSSMNVAISDTDECYPVFKHIFLETYFGSIFIITDEYARKHKSVLFFFHYGESSPIVLNAKAQIWWYDCDIKPRLYWENYDYSWFADITQAWEDDTGNWTNTGCWMGWDKIWKGTDPIIEFYHSITHRNSIPLENRPLQFIGNICNLFAAAMRGIHQRAECELITHNRGTRRTTKRKTGKEPSPYFLLKVEPGKVQKRYPPPHNKTGQKNKQHIVRGHFRHTANHPVASFNGTFWIPSHMRGNESLGSVQKGYRIVMPDNEKEQS